MNNLQFKVSSALKDLIGRDLIINDNIAIFELVKNSYDAYAKNVEITFENDKIIIADNGKGMTYNDLINKWLFLAYSAKKDGTEDNNKQTSYRDQINRHYAGAKGVGRFSCDRLGSRLKLTTRNKNSKTADCLYVNWEDFEQDQKKEFINVNIEHEEISTSIDFPAGFKNGTILEISKLRTDWNREKLLSLKRSLEKLINPFSETESYVIEIICEKEKINDEKARAEQKHERYIVNGVIKNTITKIIQLKTTKIEVKLTKDWIETSLIDRDIEIYKIKEKNNFDKLDSVQINLYYLNTAAKRAFTTEMGIQPVNYGSIFLFRNGFRILPYGEPGDDSWKLDYRAQQGFNRFLGTRGLFGRVDVQTNKIDEFKEASSRDAGLIQSTSTIQLRRFFEIVHHRLERYVVGVLWGEGFLRKEYFKDIAEVKKNRDLLSQDKENDSAKYMLNSNIGSKIDFIQLVKSLINDKNIEVISYNKDLANIFGEPELFDSVNPTVLDDLGKIAKQTNDPSLQYQLNELCKKMSDLQKQKEMAEQRAEDAEIAVRQANEETEKAKYEADIAKTKQNVAETKVKQVQKENLFLTSDVNSDVKQLTCLQHTIAHTSSSIEVKTKKAMSSLQEGNYSEVENYLNKIYLLNKQVQTVSSCVSKANYDLRASKITRDLIDFVCEYINIFCPANYKEIAPMLKFSATNNDLSWTIKFEQIKLIIILDNLISNSEKANSRKINIRWQEENNYFVLIYTDDGVGVQEPEKVFDYRYSTTGGGGLGLYHVKNIMEQDFKGTVSVSKEKKNGSEFILRFKKGEI